MELYKLFRQNNYLKIWIIPDLLTNEKMYKRYCIHSKIYKQKTITVIRFSRLIKYNVKLRQHSKDNYYLNNKLENNCTPHFFTFTQKINPFK